MHCTFVWFRDILKFRIPHIFLIAALITLSIDSYSKGLSFSVEDVERRTAHLDSMEFVLYYRYDSALMDSTYLSNGETMSLLRRGVKELHNSSIIIEKVKMSTFSSPEGRYNYNLDLAKRRCDYLRKWFRLNDVDLEVTHSHYDVARGEGIKRRAYRYLRKSIVTIYYRRIEATFVEPMRGVDLPLGAEIYESVKSDVAQVDDYQIEDYWHEEYERRRIYPLAIKTNLLYDLVTALNVEVEVPIGKRFSIMVEDVFPWWRLGPNGGRKYAFQMLELGLEPRYWFYLTKGEGLPLRGHFVGVYGMSSIYDFQWDRDGGYQGEYWSVGATYGYTLSISRWFNMEFSIGLGYLEGDYRYYMPGQNYEALYADKYRKGKVRYIGPTKVKVSLVWPIPIDYKVLAK